jgi:hypothetical protein
MSKRCTFYRQLHVNVSMFLTAFFFIAATLEKVIFISAQKNIAHFLSAATP